MKVDSAIQLTLVGTCLALAAIIVIDNHQQRNEQPEIVQVSDSIRMQQFPDRTVYYYDQWPWQCVNNFKTQKVICGTGDNAVELGTRDFGDRL